MSYGCYLEIDTGGEHKATVCEIGNMTSNVGKMFALALGKRLPEFTGTTGADLAPILAVALTCMRDPENEATYRAMEPANGWGSLAGAQQYLEKILSACVLHPKASLYVSY